MAYSNADFRELLSALVKYAEQDLDQWVRWKLPTADGEVYVHIGREPDAAAPVSSYDPVRPDMALREQT